MGGDWEYQNALINYKNIDKLIGYVNAVGGILLHLLSLFAIAVLFLKIGLT